MIPLQDLIPYRADRVVKSPNHGPRKARGVWIIVLHATADKGSELGAEAWMGNPKAKASAHLHIRRDGSITRLVDDERRAWHAGVAEWKGEKDVNTVSLGWEFANRNDGAERYTSQQYLAAAALLQHYLAQGIDREDVVSHARIAPGRKTDPAGWNWALMWDLVDAGALPDIPNVVPRNPIPPPMHLDEITIPTREHVREIIRVRRVPPEAARAGLEIAEVLLRAVAAGQSEGARKAIVKTAADAVADWIKSR